MGAAAQRPRASGSRLSSIDIYIWVLFLHFCLAVVVVVIVVVAVIVNLTEINWVKKKQQNKIKKGKEKSTDCIHYTLVPKKD